jgi:hypothetical protein
MIVGYVEEGTHLGDLIAGKLKQVHRLQRQVPPGGLKSPPRAAMGSVYSNSAGDLVFFFDHGMHLAVQIWKRCSKQTDELFEWRTPTNRLIRARSKELDVVRQNLVRYFEGSLAY